jgi:hypothetical protein
MGLTAFLVVLGLVLVAGTTALVALITGVRSARAQAVVRRWAVREGLALHESELSLRSRGPFPLDASYVFRVVLTDSDGRVQRGWVRARNRLAGFGKPRVDFVPDPPEGPARP